MTKKVIEWIAKNEKTHMLVPRPKPAREYIPEWYKALPTSKKNVDPKNGVKKVGQLKDCLPFADALTAGYIQESWTDVHFVFDEDENGHATCRWNSAMPVGYESMHMITETRNIAHPPPAGFHAIEFNLKVPWLPKTPKNWSVLITPVMNRFDLPWQTMYGIIDSDDFYHWHGNFPLYVKDTGLTELLVPAGTPLYQITPFHRENWKSFSEEIFNNELSSKRNWEYVRSYSSLYLRKMWKKKKYE